MFKKVKVALAKLPINKIAEDVAWSYSNGLIPIVTSEVGSGKTMLIPIICREMVDEVVYVLKPSRFQAQNAAGSLRAAIGDRGQRLVGYLNYNRANDESSTHSDNCIIFTTVEYALASGLIHTARNIIFDKAHEISIDLSLAKAIVHKRKEAGDEVRLAILSAPVDVTTEMEFWGENARHFTTDSSNFPIAHLHRPSWSLSAAVRYLIEDEGKRGILVFVSGKEELGDAVRNIEESLSRSGLTRDYDYEIRTIHGHSTVEDRLLATRNPKAPTKILVGTNVLEVGNSLPWVDAGVSSGETKVLHINGNVHRLVAEKLPSWRIEQQESRVCQFKSGTFILADRDAKEVRQTITTPDIIRLPLTELAMRCAKFPGIKIRELQFSKREQPKFNALSDAIGTLKTYGLIEAHADGALSLTEDGKKIATLPLSYRAAAAYCEAVHLKEVATLLPLIALIDVGDLRHDYREVLLGNQWTNSDLVHQVGVVAQIRDKKSKTEAHFAALAKTHNLSTKKYKEFTNLLALLEQKTGVKASYKMYLTEDQEKKDYLERITKQVIFRAMICNRYRYNQLMRSAMVSANGIDGQALVRASLSVTSICASAHYGDVALCTGNPRTITPKQGRSFLVIEMVTLFRESDMEYLIARFGRDKVVFSDEPTPTSNSKRDISAYATIRLPHSTRRREPAVDNIERMGSILNKAFAVNPLPSEEDNLLEGTFGALLKAAMEIKK